MEARVTFFNEPVTGDTLYKLIALVVTAIVTLWILFPSLRSTLSAIMRQQVQERKSSISACKNPDCVRCQRYRQIQKQAKTRLTWILREMRAQDPEAVDNMHRRVMAAVKRGPYIHNNPWQNPTVLMVDDLPSQEIVSEFHQSTCDYLRNNSTREFVKKAIQCKSIFVPWTVNDSPKGHWEVLQILNQGSWNPLLLQAERDDIKPWKDLLNHIRKIPGLMENCLFGNVLISRIFPGTIIEPHCGPTNVRHRLQFVIDLPSMPSGRSVNGRSNNMPSLDVGPKETFSWTTRYDIFVFDDSFIHSVSYPEYKGYGSGKKIRNQRTVLIVDLWHPSLAPIELTLLQQLYPPFITATKSTTKRKS
jgi:hypothetical protein